ncbi:hypothetical protein EVG80_15540 [Salmonella enterica subsp. enterica serovar Mississippi]|nr:hypothetical protein [Salmonella enterica subsp. enterica serovar Mississippi]
MLKFLQRLLARKRTQPRPMAVRVYRMESASKPEPANSDHLNGRVKSCISEVHRGNDVGSA